MERSPSEPRERGFSLLELLVVCAVVGIIVALVVPQISAAIRASREARAQANLRAIGSGEIAYYATNGRFGLFSSLFAGQYLGFHFSDNGDGSVGDSAFTYKIAFAANADGISVDADPMPAHATTYRWYRYRLGRSTSASGFDGVVYEAPAGVYAPSPPPSAYTLAGT